MSSAAFLNLGNLAVWVAVLGWVIRLKRTAKRQDAADLGAAGHYRPVLYLLGLLLGVSAYFLVVQQRDTPAATPWLIATLAGQVLGVVVIDRWHRREENHEKSRVELYSDVSGCLLLLGVLGLGAVQVIPMVVLVVRFVLGGS